MFRLQGLARALAVAAIALLTVPAHAGPLQQQYRDQFNRPIRVPVAFPPGGIRPDPLYHYRYLDSDGWGQLDFRPEDGNQITVHLLQNGQEGYGYGTLSAAGAFGVRHVDFLVYDDLDMVFTYSGDIAPNAWPGQAIGRGEYVNPFGLLYTWRIYQ